MNSLDYLLKANLHGLLFASCYWFFLRRHTFFGLNRAYLLTSVILALTLPLASLPTETVESIPVPVGVIALPISTVTAAPIETGPDWAQLGLLAYGLVALVLFIRLVVRVGRLVWLIHGSPRQLNGDHVLVKPNTPDIPTFSFFRYLILNPADAHNELIINHELVHIRQHHSLDVVGMAFLRVVFWPCPALWLLDRMLRQVHEFLADKPANQPAHYARFLVEYTLGGQPDTLTNGFFNPSLLKQRIMMLHQKATTRWALGKYILVLPLAFGLLAMTTAQEEIETMVSQVTNETITVSGRVTSAVSGKPLAGVSIVLKDKTQGTATNEAGEYTLVGIPTKSSLVFSFIGFAAHVVKVAKSSGGYTVINVRMARQTNKLNDVFVFGYESPPTATTSPNSPTNPNREVFTVVEQQPEFPGGMSALGQYLSKNIRYPAEARQNKAQGTVYVKFTVTADGTIDDVFIEKGIGGGCNEEALRVVKQMPKWTPGKQNRIAVAAQYVLPIQFAMEKWEDKRTGQVDPSIFKPTGSLTGDFPAIRDANYPNQPQLMVHIASAALPKSDTITPFLSDPKSNSLITIRGRGPLGELSGDPIYFIDGVEKPKNELSKLDPKEIESINVLKDAATVGYGEKGRYGVILIITKKK